jgi:hypothetical protein
VVVGVFELQGCHPAEGGVASKAAASSTGLDDPVEEAIGHVYLHATPLVR